jgi:hypothetical protein
MKRSGFLLRPKIRRPKQNRFISSHTSQRDKQEREKIFIRRTMNKVLVSMVILVCAVVIKQVDHPLAQALRDNVSKSLNASTNVEDIAVFFSDISEQYDDFKDRAISVFSNQTDKEDRQDEDTVQVDQTVQIRDEYDNSNPLLTDLIYRGDIIPMQELAIPKEAPEPEAKVITALYDMPASEADQMVDYDSGEIRADWPYNVSNTLMLPFTIINPVVGPVTSPFGVRVNPITKKEAFHYGIDIAAAKGTNILSVYEGTVKEVGRSVAYGNYIVISHPYEAETFYGHCSSISVKKGKTVKQGETIAKVGSTGWSTGNHLHFEVRRESFVLPPDKFLPLTQ